MIRTLALIAVSGFVLAVACLSVAVSLAGPDVIERGAWGWDRHGWWAHHVQSDFDWSWSDRSGGPSQSRTLPWSSQTLDVDVPADVTFTQSGGAPSLVIRGPKEALDHVVVDGGRIRFDKPMFDASDISIELTAPKVTEFSLNGSGKLDIHHYQQDALTLKLSGDGDVTAEGRTKTVTLGLSGSGDADLSGLQTDGADVRISGSGAAKVGPKSWSRIEISGSGDVTLTTHPPRQEAHVSGSGRIEQEDGSSSGSGGQDGDQT